MDLAALTADLVPLVRDCAAKAQQIRRELLDPQLKADGSIVTVADREVESILRVELPKIAPGTAVWGEEEGFREPGPEGLWLVDPIDGTTNFRFGGPLWGVSAALVKGDEILCGAISLPDIGEHYEAFLGGGARCNGQALAPIPRGSVRPEEIVSYCDESLLRFHGHGVPGKMRYLGAIVAEGIFVLQQRFRGLISEKANLYDIAAILCMAKELDADIRYVDGAPFEIPPVLAARKIERPFIVFPKDSGFYLNLS